MTSKKKKSKKPLIILKGTAALGVWLLYVHLSGEYDLKGLAYRLLARKNR